MSFCLASPALGTAPGHAGPCISPGRSLGKRAAPVCAGRSPSSPRPLPPAPRGPERPRAAKGDGSGAGFGAAWTAQPPVVDVSSLATPEDAVAAGLEQFKARRSADALACFERALALNPGQDARRAAAYNAACCHVRASPPAWDAAVAQLEDAVACGLKFSVITSDPDLAPLVPTRAFVEWRQRAQGQGPEMAVRMRAEAKAPFRFVRLFASGGLGAGAALGLAIITSRLVRALGGGPGAPDVTETVTNFGINAVAVAVLAALFRWDWVKKGEEEARVRREEDLGRLDIRLSSGKVMPLARLRGAARPVVVAGTRAQVEAAVSGAEAYKPDLLRRGICLITVELAPGGAPAVAGDRPMGFGAGTSPPKGGAATESGGVPAPKDRWRADPVAPAAWADWVTRQVADSPAGAGAGVSGGVYVALAAEGTVRASGLGAPPWGRWAVDLPPLDDVRTAFLG